MIMIATLKISRVTIIPRYHGRSDVGSGHSASSHPMQPARTVCRMTVLKGVAENDEACQGYADLINISQCDFVEIKAATYSPVWDKRNSGLSRDSIPRHDDVLQLARLLVSKLPMHLGPSWAAMSISAFMPHRLGHEPRSPQALTGNLET